MRKLCNSKVLAIIGYVLVLFIAFQISIGSLDRHMYRGVDIVRQNGNVLVVSLDKSLTVGTDSACLEAAYVLHNVVVQSGFDVLVVPVRSEWVPFNNQVLTLSDLSWIIDGDAY